MNELEVVKIIGGSFMVRVLVDGRNYNRSDGGEKRSDKKEEETLLKRRIAEERVNSSGPRAQANGSPRWGR